VPDPAPPDPSSLSARSFGLSDPGSPDGRLLGGGPDYHAEFAPGTFLFLPALGRAAPETRPAAFTLAEIRVGERLVHQAEAGVPPVRDGNCAVYPRGASIEERYEVRADGVHQTFVFASPEELSGGGDLVVRGRLETALERAPADAQEEGLRLDVPGFGGVRWGGVTGVDAAGRTARGGIRLEGDVLELSLPASFVAEASFPLTLDPLVGTTIGVQTDANHDEFPRAAYDRDEEMFLVVWQRWFSGVQLEVRGQRVERNGALAGALILVSGSSTDGITAQGPDVAAVRSSGRFLVVWTQTDSIWYPLQVVAAAVDADDGDVSAVIDVAPSLENQFYAAVGGERTLADDEGVVVWREDDVGLRMRQVTVPPAGAPSVLGAVVELQADTPLYTYQVPAISSSAGDTGYFLVVWERVDSTDHVEIEAQIVTRNAAPVGSKVFVSTADIALQNYSQSVDGDGERWVVAWERTELLVPTSTDIVGRAFERKGTELLPAWSLSYIESDANDREFRPAVVFTGDSMLVAYADENGDTDALYAKVVDPFTAAAAGELPLIYSTTDELWSVATASQWSGGDVTGAADDALIVFQSVDLGDTGFVNDDDGNIFAQVYDADPAPVDLGGGGAGGGENFNPCALAGNANFRAQLWGAEPSSAAFFVASPSTSPIACGGPTWLPALSPAVIVLRITDAYGDAQAQLPIPASAGGLTFVTQWATLTPGGSCPLLGGFAPSNALQTYVTP
jgi:hypothetical protein